MIQTDSLTLCATCNDHREVETPDETLAQRMGPAHLPCGECPRCHVCNDHLVDQETIVDTAPEGDEPEFVCLECAGPWLEHDTEHAMAQAESQ